MTTNAMAHEQVLTQNGENIVGMETNFQRPRITFQNSIPLIGQQQNQTVSVSTDGTYIWKITGVRQEMDKKNAGARPECRTSIFSPNIYLSHNDQICIGLNSRDKGDNKQKHASLFLILERGEYDGILQRPFSFKAAFCLYDQTDRQRHIIDLFRPDVNPTSDRWSQSIMNMASAVSKSVPLPMIYEEENPYVRDDTMFIKVLVDFHELSRPVLRYAFSLNPALPIHIQQCLIQTVHKNEQQRLFHLRECRKDEHQLSHASSIPMYGHARGVKRPPRSISGTKFHGISPRDCHDSGSEMEEY